MCFYSVAVVICSPIIGHLMIIMGRRATVATGMMFMGLSFSTFGLISYIDNTTVYMVLSMVARFMHGMAYSLIQTAAYSIGINFFPDNKEAIIGYIEMAVGIGTAFGPIIGSFIYAVAGVKFIFWSFGAFFIFGSLITKCIMSSKVDSVESEQNSEISMEESILYN